MVADQEVELVGPRRHLPARAARRSASAALLWLALASGPARAESCEAPLSDHSAVQYSCDMHEGMARFRIDGAWGFIDKFGKLAGAPPFDHADDFSEGLAAVKLGSTGASSTRPVNWSFLPFGSVHRFSAGGRRNGGRRQLGLHRPPWPVGDRAGLRASRPLSRSDRDGQGTSPGLSADRPAWTGGQAFRGRPVGRPDPDARGSTGPSAKARAGSGIAKAGCSRCRRRCNATCRSTATA